MTGNYAKRAKRERVRYCGMGREGENGDEERKRRGSLNEVKPWLILTDGLNKHMGIFGYHAWPYQHRYIFVHGK
jgi:hypothetical protein